MSEIIKAKYGKSGEKRSRKRPFIENGVVCLETTKGIKARFDLIDFDLSQNNWYSLNCYVIRKDKNRNYVYMHRVIMERILGRPLEDNEEPDHINGDRSDNRRDNLRVVSRSENCTNLRKSNKKSTSKYKGVSFNKAENKWRARISFKGVTFHLGYFEDEREAAMAYDRAAIYYFGENAKLNFERKDYAWEVHRQAGSACVAEA